MLPKTKVVKAVSFTLFSQRYWLLLALPSAKVVLGIANWRPCGIVDLLRPYGIVDLLKNRIILTLLVDVVQQSFSTESRHALHFFSFSSSVCQKPFVLLRGSSIINPGVLILVVFHISPCLLCIFIRLCCICYRGNIGGSGPVNPKDWARHSATQ